MPRFLSEAWIDDLARAARATTVADWPSGERLVVEQVVISPTAGWVMEISTAGMRVTRGRASHPGAVDLTVVVDGRTAEEIVRGTLNAQSALATGRLRVRGDLARLGRLQGALAAMGDVFAAVRDSTELPGAPGAR